MIICTCAAITPIMISTSQFIITTPVWLDTDFLARLLQLCKRLKDEGYTVIGTVRNASSQLEAAGVECITGEAMVADVDLCILPPGPFRRHTDIADGVQLEALLIAYKACAGSAAGYDIAKSDPSQLQDAIRHPTIDLLVVAAGIQEIDTLQTATRDIIMRQFEVNALGPVLVVQALLPRLQPGSKVRSRNRLWVHVWQMRTLVWC